MGSKLCANAFIALTVVNAKTGLQLLTTGINLI